MSLPVETEPVIGWRGWRLTGTLEEPRLQSMIKDFVWPIRKPMEVFDSNWHLDVTNGIYSYKTLNNLRENIESDFSVIGEVYLWGHIIEGSTGWRSQFAYPKKLFVASNKHDVLKILALEDAYGIPVEEMQDFPKKPVESDWSRLFYFSYSQIQAQQAYIEQERKRQRDLALQQYIEWSKYFANPPTIKP